MTDIETLIKRALRGEADPDVRRELAERADEVIAFLADTPDDIDEEALRAITESPDALADIFAALAEPDEGVSDEDREVLEHMLEQRQASAESIGLAFRNSFMRVIRDVPHLTDWATIFRGVEDAPEAWQERLATQPDVKAADPDIEPVLRYGVSPTLLWMATRAVEMTASRLDAAGEVDAGDTMLLARVTSSRETYRNELAARLVVLDMMALTHCPQPLATALLGWFFDLVAHGFVHLFPGFEATAEGEYLRLSRTGGDDVDILDEQERWDVFEDDLVGKAWAPAIVPVPRPVPAPT